MAIIVSNNTSGGVSGSNNITVSMTTAAGDNFLLVGFGRAGTGLVKSTGVTFDGQAMTNIVQADGTVRTTVELWYLINPHITTANIVASFPTAADHCLAAVSLKGVNVSSPIRGFVNTAASSSSISDIISSATNDLVVDFCTLEATTGSPNEDAGQTLITTCGIGATIDVSGGMSYEAGAASNTLGWSWTGTVDSALALVSIKPKLSAGGSQVIII